LPTAAFEESGMENSVVDRIAGVDPGDPIDESIDRFESDGAMLAGLVRSIPPERIAEHAPFDGMCALEQICHLRDLEQAGWQQRFTATLHEDNPTIHNFDGAAVSAASNYHAEDVATALTAWLQLRRQLVTLLRACDAPAFERTATYAESGRTHTLRELLAFALGHDEDHLIRLSRLTAHFA
jgi:hypothetical protein